LVNNLADWGEKQAVASNQGASKSVAV